MPACAKEIQYRQTLRYSGQAFIIFGIWSIVKFLLQIYLNPVDWAGVAALDTLPVHTIQVVFSIFFAFFLIVDILIRIYVGLSASKEAKGKPRRVFYLFVAALYIVLTVVMLLPSGYDTNYEEKISFATLFFDATNIIVLVIIIVNSLKLRKLKI